MKKFGTILLVTSALFLVSSSVFSNARDADGSRMQARSHSLGDQATDRLAPPSDRVDWRYVRVKKAANVKFKVNSQPASATVRLAVTSATGKKVLSQSSKKGSLRASKKLQPGLYYVSVGSKESVNYDLTIE